MAAMKRVTVAPAAHRAVVVGVFEEGYTPTPSSKGPLPRELVHVELRPRLGGPAVSPSQPNLSGPLGQVFARFEPVAPGDYEIVASRRNAPGGSVLARGRQNVSVAARQTEATLQLQPLDTLLVVPTDPVSHNPLPTSKIDTVRLDPPQKDILDPEKFLFEVVPGTTYTIEVKPKRGLHLKTTVSLTASPGEHARVVELERRKTVYFVVIDSKSDEASLYHNPNIDGLKEIVTAFDGAYEVKVLVVDPRMAGSPKVFTVGSYVAPIGMVMPESVEVLEEDFHPFAIFGGGSWSEWYRSAADADFDAALTKYMQLVRAMDIPMFAVCGSHQLVAVAFNGWTALEHMSDTAERFPITHDRSPPIGLKAPSPRLGEEGVYPIGVTPAGAADPIVAEATGGRPIMAAIHHKDMVVQWTSDVAHIFSADPGRSAFTNPSQISASHRCVCQGLRYGGTALGPGTRLLYTVQFHPEVDRFPEAEDRPDQGFGRRLLTAFLKRTRQWWDSGV